MVSAKLKRKVPGPSRPKKKTKTGKFKLKKPSKVRIKRRSRRAINVRNDTSLNVKALVKKYRTRKEKRKIGRIFNEGYSPFKDIVVAQIQEQHANDTDKAKWIWRCNANTEWLKRYWNFQPYENMGSGYNNTNITDSYLKSQTQRMYLGELCMVYEIMNPANYDVNLIIYNLVCKTDTSYSTNDQYYFDDTRMNLSTATRNSPIRLIKEGLDKMDLYNYHNSTATNNFVADPTMKTLSSIETNPTDSLAFNTYWKIVRKKVIKLEPGATMTYTFKYKPRKLFSRGGFFYRYGESSAFAQVSDDRYQGIGGVTCGTLFKFYGQISGSGSTTAGSTEVSSLSGKIMIKEKVTNKFYFMNSKMTYTIYSHTNKYSASQEGDMEVINSDSIKQISNIDLINTNN